MKVYRYWASAQVSAQDSKGKRLLLKKWAGSNDSASDAKSAAERAVRALQDRMQQARGPNEEYLYGVRDIPEEFIREVTPNSLVTRNRMGCLVLNTTEAFFADVDISEPGFFAKLFRKETRQKKEDEAVALLNQFMESHPSAGARIYKTRAGLRYLFIHAPLGVTEETLGWLKALNSDALYTTLCRDQKCFRARLSPKYWRIDMARPNNYPRETPETSSAFDGWRRDYEQRSKGFAVCKFIGTAGRSSIHSDLSALVQDHDRATSANSDLPLA